jgi:hypothetical protein
VTCLVDTNIISELRKRERGHPGVVRWAASVDPAELHTSVLIIGEIRRGIELKRRFDPSQAAALEAGSTGSVSVWAGAFCRSMNESPNFGGNPERPLPCRSLTA